MIAVQRVGAALVAFIVLTAVRGGCFQGRCPSVIHCRPYSDVHVPSPSPVTPGHFRRIARVVSITPSRSHRIILPLQVILLRLSPRKVISLCSPASFIILIGCWRSCW